MTEYHGALVVGPTDWKSVAQQLLPGAWACGVEADSLEIRAAGLQVRDSLFIATPEGPLVAWLCRKPMLEPTVARQALATGTGGVNIDGCRISHVSPEDLAAHQKSVEAIKAKGGVREGSWKNSSDLSGANDVTSAGRWPGNFLLVHHQECTNLGVQKAKATSIAKARPSVAVRRLGTHVAKGGHQSIGREQPVRGYANLDGTEDVQTWDCHPSCPSHQLGIQSGVTRSGVSATPHSAYVGQSHTRFLRGKSSPENQHGGEGTASRFFFQAKDLQDLYSYLAKLVTPPGGKILKVGTP